MELKELSVFEKIKSRPYYKNKEGKRLPGVTTILNSHSDYMKISNLIGWACDCGKKGVDANSYSTVASEIGTVAHLLIAGDLSKQTLDLSEYSPKVIIVAKQCKESFDAWKENYKFEPLLVEERMVSEIHQYGGTIDLYGITKINGDRVLIDLKSSTQIFKDYHLQASAYKQLLLEQGHKLAYQAILRIPKEASRSHELFKIYNSELSELLFQQFLNIKKVHQADKVIDKLMKGDSDMWERIKEVDEQKKMEGKK